MIGIAADRGLIAVTRVEAPMGCTYDLYVEIHDIATNKLVGTTQLASNGDGGCGSNQPGWKPTAAVAARTAKVAGVLGELGFAPVAAEMAAGVARTGDTKWTGSFAAAKLGVVVSDSRAHVLTRTTELGAIETEERLHDAAVIAEPHLAVVWTFHAAPEGCGDNDPTRADVMVLAKTP